MIRAQAPSHRVELTRAVIGAIARDLLQVQVNGNGADLAASIAEDIERIVAPAALLQSSLGEIAHDDPEEPEARASLRDQ